MEIRNEKYYAHQLAMLIDGKTEVKADDGTICDIVTDQFAIEVKFAERWYEAIGQVLHSASQHNREPLIYVIAKNDGDQRFIDRARILSVQLGIVMLTHNDIHKITEVELPNESGT